jgi:hypothetical protein
VNAAYSCHVCAHEISSAATHYTTEYAQVLCASCARQPANHIVAYPDCSTIRHTVDDHAVVVGTRLAAHRELLPLAQEVTG